MNIFYAVDNQQQGPIPLAEFQALVTRGTVTNDTLVYTEGMKDWLPLSQARSQGFMSISPASTPEISSSTLKLASRNQNQYSPGGTDGITIDCPTCGYPVNPSDLIPFQNTQVCPHCRNQVLQQVREGVSLETFNSDLRYAGFGVRLGSFIIDYIVVQVYTQILSFALLGVSSFGTANGFNGASIALIVAYFVLLYAGSFFYYIYMMGSPKHQGTLGMKALKLKIVRPDGSPITKWRAFGRQLASIISGVILGIGYLMLIWDDEKRTLHDRMADTRIVYK